MPISSSILSDLNTGNAVLKLKPYVAGTGVALDASGGVDFSSADEIFTLEDSFTISKDAPSFSGIRIDQGHKTIDSNVTPGDNYTMSGRIPSIATELLSLGFEAVTAAVSAKNGTNTYSATAAHKLGSLDKEYTVLAVSQSGNSAIVFARVKFVFSEPQHENNSTPSFVEFNAVVLPNEDDSGDFACLPTHTVTT